MHVTSNAIVRIVQYKRLYLHPAIPTAKSTHAMIATGYKYLTMKTGLNILLENPNQTGADLVVGCVAALREHKPPMIVVDMGTATTMVVVDKNRAFIGGAIIPGVKLSLSALAAGTSLLPDISISAPKKCIASNTVDCMRSGAVYGTASLIDGMIERMEEELGYKTTVIATGGIAKFIVPLCNKPMIYDKDLLIKGLAALYRDNKRK